MMNNKIYQRIYDELSKYLKKDDSLIVYMEYGEESYSFAFYVKNGKKIVKCYDLPGVKESTIMESFKVIDAIVAPERNAMKTKWSNMTITISNDGDMHADIDYTDLSQGSYKYKKEWKEKYLK